MQQDERTRICRLSAETLREHLDELTEISVQRTLSELPSYATFTPEQLRPRAIEGQLAFLNDLEHPEGREFSRIFTEIGKRRALEKHSISDVLGIALLTIEVAKDILFRTLKDPASRLLAVEQMHAVGASAMIGVIASFWSINTDLLKKTETLVQQLSTPILPVYAGVLLMPLIGAVDSPRAAGILETVLAGIVQHSAEVVIVDVTGSADVGSQAAATYLSTIVRAARLLGARLILVGMSANTARSFVEEGVELPDIAIFSNLQAGLEHALALRGFVVSRRRSG